jgi:AcrR family transcriptional regulator
VNNNHYDIQEFLEDYVKDYPDKEIRILNAAINAFSEKGFKSTTTSEIASRAGVAEGTIFRYFPSKDAILEKMLPLLIRVMLPKVEKPIKNIIKETAGEGLTVIFSTIIYDRLILIRDNQKFLVSVLPELIHRPQLFEQLKGRIFPMIRMYIGQVIESAKQRGEIREDTDTDIVMYHMIGFIFSYSVLHGLDDESSIKADVDTFITNVVKGLEA